MKPIYLLADSQLLFLKNEKGEHYLKTLIGDMLDASAKCAYIGVSNGDEEAFYEIFVEAMNILGLSDCKKITSSFPGDEQEFLDKADLILLAGGDTELGLKVFKETGIEQVLRNKQQQGTILIGVSAGAVQLGWEAFETTEEKHKVTEGLKFIPFIVLVHAEKKDFNQIETYLRGSASIQRAYEIPMGAGLIYHADHTVEAVRKPINEFILKEEEFNHTLIFPKME